MVGTKPTVLPLKSGPALRSLRHNLHLTALEAQGRVLAMDVARALDLLEREEAPLGICFSDPPYADDRWPLLLAGLGERDIIAPGGLLIVEHASKPPPACPAGMDQGRSYRYGDTGLVVFVRK